MAWPPIHARSTRASVANGKTVGQRVARVERAARQDPIKAVIPPNPTRKRPCRYDKIARKGRNVIERMFCRPKDRHTLRQPRRHLPVRIPLGCSPDLVDQLSPDPDLAKISP